MNKIKEENFPRGGKKPTKSQITEKKNHSTFKLFGKQKNIKKKKKLTNQKKKETKNVLSSEPLSLTSAELLTYHKIQEGMIVLGCIREINRMDIGISLPGRLSAKVPITNISTPYTNLLKSIVEQNNAPDDYHSLKKLFHVGQYVRCKIIRVEHSPDNELHKVIASIAPHDIQSDWKFVQLEQNLVITAAVTSIEDHGYVMDLGVKETRAFLPKTNTNDVVYDVGQVIWANIRKVTKSKTAATVILSTNDVEIFKNCVVSGSLHHLLPGMKVNFTIEKVISDGFEGRFLDNFIGYLSETHLAEPLQDKNVYNVGDTVEAYVLYIVPTTKLTFLTLKDIAHKPEMRLNEGHLIPSAKVLSRVGKGLYLKLTRTEKGFVSHRRLKDYRPDVDVDELLNTYKVGSMLRCCVLDYDYMESVYICTCEKELLNEKYFSVNDFYIGDVVPVVIEKIHSCGVEVKVGRVTCFVQNLLLTDIPLHSLDIGKKFKVGQKLNGRVLNIDIEAKTVTLTLKQTLVESKSPVLTSFDDFNKKREYEGIVVLISPKGVLVKFYAGVRGFVPAREINLNPNETIENVFYLGQVIKCRVLSSNPKQQKMILTMKPAPKLDIKIGDRVNATVTKVTEKGVEFQINQLLETGILPTAHSCNHPKLAPFLLNSYCRGKFVENLMCIGLTTENIYLSKRESQFFTDVPIFDELSENMILRCAFRNTFDKGMLLFCPIRNFKRYIFIPNKLISDEPIKDLDDLKLCKYEPIMAKIIKVDRENQAIIATTKLSECWDKTIDFALKYLSSYLIEVGSIREALIDRDKELGDIAPGNNTFGTVTNITDAGDAILSLDNGFSAFVPKELCMENLQKGQKIPCVVLWVDYPEQKIIVSTLSRHVDTISGRAFLISNNLQDLHVTVKCEILLVHSDFVLAVMLDKGHNQFLYLPTKVHYNDFVPDTSIYEVGEICFAKVVEMVHSSWYIGLLKSKKLKRIEMFEVNEENVNEGEVEEKEEVKEEKLEEVNERGKKRPKQQKQKQKPKQMKKDNESVQEDQVLLPGVENFWNLTLDTCDENVVQNDSPPDSEEDEKVESKTKKRKLTKMEQIQQAHDDEMRIREMEAMFADNSVIPTTAEQFDRLVLSKPNSSHAWMYYMAFHLQSAEIEKARAVARKALNTISFRNEEERLNIWIALLNLENCYGTKDSFSTVLEEAARMNDSRLIYMSALSILADSKKQTDFTELLNVVLRKHKHKPETWPEAAQYCFQLNMPEKARHLLQRALDCLNKTDHVNLIIKFAYLELKYGNAERAETLFEQVLASYPRRVDIWSSYVDMLRKSSKIDVARRVLERATSLKLPARKMKTLFDKFIKFEEEYGDEEAVVKVRNMAVKFVENAQC